MPVPATARLSPRTARKRSLSSRSVKPLPDRAAIHSVSGLGSAARLTPSPRRHEVPLLAVEQVAAEVGGLEEERLALAGPARGDGQAVAHALHPPVAGADRVAAVGHRVAVPRIVRCAEGRRGRGQPRVGGLPTERDGRGVGAPLLGGGRVLGSGRGVAGPGDGVLGRRVVVVVRRHARPVDVRQAHGRLRRVVERDQAAVAAARRTGCSRRSPRRRSPPRPPRADVGPVWSSGARGFLPAAWC